MTGEVCFYGGVVDRGRSLRLAHVHGTRVHQEGEVKLEVGRTILGSVDESRGGGVLRRVFEALGLEQAHDSLFYALSEGPK